MKKIITILFSILYGVLLVLGKSIYDNHNLSMLVDRPVYCVCILVLVSCISGMALIILERLVFYKIGEEKNNFSKSRSRMLLVIGGILLFAVYCLPLLAYYPGIYSYDADNQTQQILGLLFLNNHHPVVHTLLWKFVRYACVDNGINCPLIVYGLIQITIVILSYLYVINWMLKRQAKKWYVFVMYIYFLVNPLLQIFAMLMTKDILMTCALLVFVTKFIDEDACGLVISGTVMCLLRNNMPFAVLVTSLIILFLARQKLSRIWKSMIVVSVISLVVVNVVYSWLGVAAIDTSAESLSVPIQQLGYVYVHEPELEQEKRDVIEVFIPNVSEYHYRKADYIKDSFNNAAYNSDKELFWRVWAALAVRYPADYISAFLDLNISIWYVNASPIQKDVDWSYIEDHVIEGLWYYPMKLESKLPKAYQWYTAVAHDRADFMNWPVLRRYFGIYMPFISLTVGLYLSIVESNKKLLAQYIFLLTYWCTYLLGPTAIFRYMYPFYVLLPVYVGLFGIRYEK